jgi:hypothetical protein
MFISLISRPPSFIIENGPYQVVAYRYIQNVPDQSRDGGFALSCGRSQLPKHGYLDLDRHSFVASYI